MKRIAAVFDGLNLAGQAMDFAIRFSKRLGSHLVGIFPESFLYHEYDFADLLGKTGMSVVKIKHAVTKEAQKRFRSGELFAKGCERTMISYSLVHPRGITIDEVLKESTFAELIMIDKREQFSKVIRQLPSTFLRQLLSDSRCPLLLLDENSLSPKHLLLLYDGKPDSVYAIKLFFSLVDTDSQMSTELLYVSTSGSGTEIPDIERLRALIECHRPETIFTCVAGDGKQTITDYVKTLGKNVLAVAGAYGRGSTSRWIMPSIADRLIAECDCSIFVAHNR